MAKVNISAAPSSPYGAGELQLQNKAPLDGTLRVVTDSANTASPLILSTTLVQTTSTLKITTADNPYIDAEDNSGNNRFTVGRDPSSQLVTVDFASLPTALTTPVGAIRTGTDGVNLANVQTFLENGNIGFGTDTPGSKIDVHSAANTVAQFNRTGTGNSQIQHLMTGTARWTTGYTSAAGNYSIYDNVNAVFRTNLSNTGKLTIGNGDTALTGQLNVKGSGATSATKSLLLQNSSSNQLGFVDDSGQWVLGAGAVKTWFTGNYLVSLNNTTGNGLAITSIDNSAYNAIAVNNDFDITGNGRVQLGRSTATSTFTASSFTFNIVSAATRVVTTQGGGYSQGFTFTGNYGSSKTLSIGSGDPGSGFQGIFYDATKQFGIYKGTFETTTSPTLIATTVNSVGINTSSVNASAVLQADSTTQGFLPPRMTTAQKVTLAATAIAGLMIYDTNLNKMCVYTGAGWETITSI